MTVTAYSANAAGSGTTLDAGPFDLVEGDYLLAFAGNYGGPQGVTLASTDAALTLIPHYDVTDWYPNTIACGKLRNAPTKAGTTLRATWGGACTYRWLVVLRVRPDADHEIWAHSWSPGVTGESTSPAGNVIDTIGDRVLLVGAASNGGGTAWSSLTLGGEAPDATISPLSRGRVVYRALSANASSQTLSATLASSDEWAAWTMALRECPVGATRTSIRVNTVNGGAYAHITPPEGGVLVTAWAKPDMPTGDYPHDRGNLILFELNGTAVYAQVLTCNGTVDSALTFASKFNANSMNGAGSSFDEYAGLGDLCMINETTVRRVDERDLWGWNFLAYWYRYDDVADELAFHIWAKPGHGEEIRHEYNEYTLAEARAVLVDNGMPSGVAATWVPGDVSTIRLGFSSNDSPTSFDMTAVRIYECEALPTFAEIDAIAENADADTSAWGDYVFEWSDGAPVLTDRSGNGHTLSVTGTLYEGDAFELASSAGPVELEGSIAGTSSVSGSLRKTAVLNGVVAALAVATGALSSVGTIRGRNVSLSSVSGALTTSAAPVVRPADGGPKGYKYVSDGAGGYVAEAPFAATRIVGEPWEACARCAHVAPRSEMHKRNGAYLCFENGCATEDDA